MTKDIKQEIIIQNAERIVIDYANLSGRESENRAEFRERTFANISHALDTYRDAVVAETLMRCAEVCHEFILSSKNLVEIDAAEKIQKDILTLLPQEEKND